MGTGRALVTESVAVGLRRFALAGATGGVKTGTVTVNDCSGALQLFWWVLQPFVL